MTTKKNISSSKLELPDVPHWIHRMLSYAGGCVMLYMLSSIYTTVTTDHEKVVAHEAKIMIIEKKIGLAFVNSAKIEQYMNVPYSKIDSICWVCEMVLPEELSIQSSKRK